jgi:anaerobic C4-dicarboxylate transporter
MSRRRGRSSKRTWPWLVAAALTMLGFLVAGQASTASNIVPATGVEHFQSPVPSPLATP